MPQRIKVAHVGHMGVEDDEDRWRTVLGWLAGRDASFDRDPDDFEHDLIDLNRSPSRDFLGEHGAYDVIVTHHLWGEMGDGYAIRTGGAAQSPLHGVEAWRRRLHETGARYVFLAGGAFNIATLGGSVPGYEMVEFLGRWYTSVLRRSGNEAHPDPSPVTGITL